MYSTFQMEKSESFSTEKRFIAIVYGGWVYQNVCCVQCQDVCIEKDLIFCFIVSHVMCHHTYILNSYS